MAPSPLSLASAEIFPGGGNVDILLIFFRLLTMQCKWTFTKHITLSAQKEFAPFHGLVKKNALRWQQQPGILR